MTFRLLPCEQLGNAGVIVRCQLLPEGLKGQPDPGKKAVSSAKNKEILWRMKKNFITNYNLLKPAPAIQQTSQQE
jgi:hypothetical protein